MKKFITIVFLLIGLALAGYYAFVYYFPYSEGYRSGQLIKFSKKGIAVKTWEGEISQGISGAQIFKFSVLDKDEKAISSMKRLQGRYVKVTYVERLRTFPWLGDTNYFVTRVEPENSPYTIQQGEAPQAE